MIPANAKDNWQCVCANSGSSVQEKRHLGVKNWKKITK